MRHIVVPVNLMLCSGNAVCLTTYFFISIGGVIYTSRLVRTDRIPSPPTTKSANTCVPSEKYRFAPPSGMFSIETNSLRS